MKDFLGVVLVAVLSITVWLGLACGLLALIGLLFMLVWNGVVVSAFPTAPEITFWQSFVVVFVLGMFTGNISNKRS